jgi:uncharacterized protein (UPF0332 family)
MARKIIDEHLLRIAKAHAKEISNFRLGIHLHSTTGYGVDTLVSNASRDRLRLARQILAGARWAAGQKPQYRLALARAYYSIYHAARAVVFFVEGGDDHEAHSELPKHIPKDFPNCNLWENTIKTARFERNRADYDPYPKLDHAFADAAKCTLKSAQEFLPLARQYLLRKGCKL